MKILKSYFIHKYEKLLDWFIFKFWNPYNLNPGGNCPTQDGGKLEDGNYYYFRARGSQWYLKISKNTGFSNDFDFDNEIFHWGDRNYCMWPHAGWLSKRECIRLGTDALNRYFESENDK